MASYPPPFGPPGPYSYTAKQQRRWERDRIRAQQDILRAQSKLYRQQTRATRRRSLLGPLVVLSAGIFLLLVHTGHLSSDRLASRFNQWWPLALVLAGVVLVLEWFADQKTMNQAGSPHIRRGAGGGIFLLISLLVLASAYLNTYSRDQPWKVHGLSITPENLQEVFGDKHERDQEIDLPFAAGASLAISNPHGDVTIMGRSDDNQIHISINKQLYSSSDADADAKAAQLNPVVSNGSGYLQLSVPRLEGASADLSITLPESAQTTITDGYGDIHISGMHAAVNATADHGDIEVSQIIGPVIARMNNNDATFTVDQVTGDVTIKGHAQDLTLSQISGHVSIEGDFYGDTHLEHLHGPIEFHTARTELAMVRLEGQLDISPDEDLMGSEILGPITLTTRSRNISLDRVLGDLTVSNSNGTIDVTDAAPLANVKIENHNGAVNLTLPDHTDFVLDALAQDGDVADDFGLEPARVGNRNAAHGTVGSGRARVQISTSHADINVHKGDVQAPVPNTPGQPAAPIAPTRSHSRVSGPSVTL